MPRVVLGNSESHVMDSGSNILAENLQVLLEVLARTNQEAALSNSRRDPAMTKKLTDRCNSQDYRKATPHVCGTTGNRVTLQPCEANCSRTDLWHQLYSPHTWMRFTWGLFLGLGLSPVKSGTSVLWASSFTYSGLGWGNVPLCCHTSIFLAVGCASLTAFTVYSWGSLFEDGLTWQSQHGKCNVHLLAAQKGILVCASL